MAAVPTASLVVIAFNEAARAPDCLRSILDQRTWADVEVILVDDGSTDGTLEAVAALAREDARLRIIRLDENRGRGAARARGVAAARGVAVGFVDADITLPPDWLDRCLAALPGHAAVGGIAVPDGDATVVARISGASPRVVAGSMPITGNNVLFDREALSRFGFDPADRLGEDFRLAHRMQRNGLSLARVPGLTVRHDEGKSYGKALRWRFENGIDASTHPRELGVIRLADLVFAGWLGAWLLGVVLAIVSSPAWLLLGVAAGIGAGVAHAVSRFRPAPFGPFVVACLIDVPLVTAYLLGRTVGLPRLITGRR